MPGLACPLLAAQPCLQFNLPAVSVLLLPRFELAAPPRFGLVCLRLKGVGDGGNRALLAAVNRAGMPTISLRAQVLVHMLCCCLQPSGPGHQNVECTDTQLYDKKIATTRSIWPTRLAGSSRALKLIVVASFDSGAMLALYICLWPLLPCTGLSHMVGTDLDGLFTVRVAIGQANTQLQHVQRVWGLIQEQAGLMLAQQEVAAQQAAASCPAADAAEQVGEFEMAYGLVGGPGGQLG